MVHRATELEEPRHRRRRSRHGARLPRSTQSGLTRTQPACTASPPPARSKTMSAHTIKTQHVATRLNIATAVPFDAFRAALEDAAPRFQQGAIEDIVNRGGTWGEVLAAVAENAPHGLMVFA